MSLPTNDRLPCTCTPEVSPCPGCTQWRRSQLARPGTRSTGKALALSAAEIRSHLREAVHARTRALHAWQLGDGTKAAYLRAKEEVDRWQRRLRRLQASPTQE
jgi:hypothetical protein